MGKKKKQVGERSEDRGNQSKVGDNRNQKSYDNDIMVFISMSQELKDEGNKLFQKRDVHGAMTKFQKALKLLPSNHIDVSNLRSNMATCYMQMGLVEYPRAIHECNLALEVTPKYGKALLKRARCYLALDRLDLALRDVSAVLKMEPNNVMALEVSDKVTKALQEKGLRINDLVQIPLDYAEPPHALPLKKVVKQKNQKKSNKKKAKDSVEIEEKQVEEKSEEKKSKDGISANKAKDSIVEKKAKTSKKQKAKEKIDEKQTEEKSEEKKLDSISANKAEDSNKSKMKKAREIIDVKQDDVKEVVEERSNGGRKEDIHKKTAKLVFGEDIRYAELPVSCSLFQLREVIHDRFPNLESVLVKCRDQEGDLVTITSDEELRWAETQSQVSLRFHIVEVNPDQDPLFTKLNVTDVGKVGVKASKNGYMEKSKEFVGSSCIEDWIFQFAQLFKNHVGFESDRYLDFHDLGMKLYSEAIEEAVTSEEAQGLFDMAGYKFQEMEALALFNWGNVHMCRARKKFYIAEDSSKEQVHEQIKSSYEWSHKEYKKAGEKYEEAIKIKSDFYEGFLALAQQQFEQAKLSWYYALNTNVDFATWPSTEVLHLYNNAEDNMEKGMLIWEESKEQHLSETSNQKTGLDGLLSNISSDEIASREANTRSQINLLWGTMLYERSIVEYKLGLPVWHECLAVAVEKFELAGASSTDIAVMLKNHCSNNTAVHGFKIDEIVQAWNEMYEAKKWQNRVPSFRLEPLLRRKVSKIYHAFELA